MNVFFKLMQKDDKKEVLKFEIPGNDDGEAEGELFNLSGSIVVLSMASGGTAIVNNLMAEFLSMQRDSKKTVMKFAIKGDSEEEAQKLYKYAGRNVDLEVQPSQMSIDEFRDEPRDGVRGKINPDGTVDLDGGQMSIEEAAAAVEDPGTTTGDGTYNDVSEKLKGQQVDKVTNIATKRGKKKDEEPKPDPSQETTGDDDLEPIEDDGLPF